MRQIARRFEKICRHKYATRVKLRLRGDATNNIRIDTYSIRRLQETRRVANTIVINTGRYYMARDYINVHRHPADNGALRLQRYIAFVLINNKHPGNYNPGTWITLPRSILESGLILYSFYIFRCPIARL